MSGDAIALAGIVMSGRDLLSNVKVYKRRCRNLITRCEILISGLREGDGAVPAGHQAALSEAEAILESIRGRVFQWAQLSTARSLLRQDTIRNGLDEYDRRIDTCIATYNIKIGQHLAQAREQHIVAAQHDLSEIRGMVQDLLEEFTRYRENPTLDVSSTNPAFRTVVHDIEEETRDTQSVISEENDTRTLPSILSIDTFQRQMTVFSRSLVNLELVDRNASERVYVPNRRYHAKSPSEPSVGHQRFSSASPPQLPPLDFGEITVEETTPTEHSPSASDYPSVRSMSAVSRSVSMQNSLSSGTEYTSLHGSCLEIESQQLKRPSISVASGSQSLRRFSLFVPETVWDPSRSPKALKPETLESVIQYLLDYAEDDNEQRSVFFIAHPAFVAPLHVLRILIQRYDEASLIQHPERRVDIQARVLRLLNDWLDNEHVIFDEDILIDMREFLSYVNDPDSGSEELDGLILKILHEIRQKDYRRPPAPLISPYQATQRECPAPRDLAIALAALEGEGYKRIVASEYMAYVGGLGQPYCPNLSAAIGLNQLISKWVRSCILVGKGRNGITARSKMKQYFVETAKECRNIRNFSSSGAIISALRSQVITRLTATQGGTSFLTTRAFGNLIQFFDKKCNYEGYRKALRNQQMCSIPWHVVDLEDVQAVMTEGGGADTGEEHIDPPRIHLERWARLKRWAMSALHYHVPYREEDVPRTAKAYLMAGLQRALGESFDQEQRSLVLKAEEDEIVFRGAGFSIK